MEPSIRPSFLAAGALTELNSSPRQSTEMVILTTVRSLSFYSAELIALGFLPCLKRLAVHRSKVWLGVASASPPFRYWNPQSSENPSRRCQTMESTRKRSVPMQRRYCYYAAETGAKKRKRRLLPRVVASLLSVCYCCPYHRSAAPRSSSLQSNAYSLGGRRRTCHKSTAAS